MDRSQSEESLMELIINRTIPSLEFPPLQIFTFIYSISALVRARALERRQLLFVQSLEFGLDTFNFRTTLVVTYFNLTYIMLEGITLKMPAVFYA